MTNRDIRRISHRDRGLSRAVEAGILSGFKRYGASLMRAQALVDESGEPVVEPVVEESVEEKSGNRVVEIAVEIVLTATGTFLGTAATIATVWFFLTQ